MREDETLGTTR
jgi:hypothetical protein